MSLTLRKLALKNPATDDVVVMSNIMEGVDGAAAMGWTLDGQQVQIEDGQTLEFAHTGELDVRVMRVGSADLATIQSLIGTKVEVSGHTIEGFFVMRDLVLLNQNAQYNSNLVHDRVYLTLQAPKGYVGGDKRSQAFYLGLNALRLYDVRQGDSDLLSGFEEVGTPGLSQSNGTQTVTTDTEGHGVVSHPIFFPFEGVRVIASADFSVADIRFHVGVRFLDADEQVISDSTDDFIASGRRSHTALVPSGTVYIQFLSTRQEETGASGSWSFTRPAIRTNSVSYSP